MGSLPDAELVVAFLNTLDEEDHTDVLDDPALWLAWLTEHDAPVDADGTSVDPELARPHRDALRAAITGRAAVADRVVVADRTTADQSVVADHAPVTDRAGGLPTVAIRVRLDAGTPVLDADDPVGRVLAAAVRLTIAGEWDRVKICPADNCRWAFYDRSRNHSRTWCSMEACGNRAKARQWRQRRRT